MTSSNDSRTLCSGWISLPRAITMAVTHLDSLSHMFYQGKMYNGYSQADVNRQERSNWR